MKKKSLLLLAGGLLTAVAIRAAVVYSGYLVNEPALAYSKTFILDLKNAGVNHRQISSVAATSAISSATITAPTFTDGSLGSGTITVTSTSGLTGVQATDQITVTATDTLKNAVLFFTGPSGAPIRLRAFYDWKVGATTALTATSIATTMNRLSGIHASAAGSVVYATATAAGTAANSFVLTKQAAAGLTIAADNFAGGVDDAYVTIGGQQLIRGTAWAVGASTAATAGNIATAVRANTTLNALVSVSTSASAVMTITARAVGTAGNLALATFPSAITKSGTAMTSGTDAAWTINTATIHKTAHGLYTGLPVLYTTGTIAIGGLTNATTYYAYRVDADNFQLATTSTGAIAGSGIVLTSSSTAGPHTYTLSPLTIAGTFSFKWQTSDDNVTYTDVAVSSVTFASPYTPATSSWDFGAVGHRYLRVNEVAGTAGAVNLQVAVTGRSSD